MQATGWIAIYAAAVSTVSLGWQIWKAQQARRPQVTVLLDTWRTSQVPGRRTLEEATIRIRNQEDFAIVSTGSTFTTPGIPSGRTSQR